MLNKFENPVLDLPSDDPRFMVMDTWANLDGLYRQQFKKIITLLGEFEWRAITERSDNPDSNYAVRLEAQLQSELPEFNLALNGLRMALDKVSGWHIKWRHYERGEVVGSEYSEEVESDYVISRTVRGPVQYPPNEGWLLGSQVGVDRDMGGINVWLEIGSDQESLRGINYQFGEMHAIELTRPDQVPAS